MNRVIYAKDHRDIFEDYFIIANNPVVRLDGFNFNVITRMQNYDCFNETNIDLIINGSDYEVAELLCEYLKYKDDRYFMFHSFMIYIHENKITSLMTRGVHYDNIYVRELHKKINNILNETENNKRE